MNRSMAVKVYVYIIFVMLSVYGIPAHSSQEPRAGSSAI